MEETPYVIQELARLTGLQWALLASNLLMTVTGYKNRQASRQLVRAVRELLAANQTLMDIKKIDAANYTKGRLFWSPRFVVVHWTAGTLDATVKHFRNPKTRASAHLVVKDGTVVQMVSFDDTAWHAGDWIANLQSIGIEHEGGPGLPISNETYQTSANVIAEIHKRYGWGEPSPATVRPHSAFRPTACPGTLDVARLIVLAREAYHPKAVVVPVEYEVVPAEAHVEEQGATETYAPFSENLSPSQDKRDEVARMQQYLVDTGFLKPESLVDEAGNSMKGYYGKRTQAAVDRFQKAVGIPSASKFGWWYDKTRAAANARLTVTKQPTNVS